MPVPGLFFRTAPPAAAGLPSRADVALFVGLVARRTNTARVPTPLPDEIAAWLEQAGWARTAWSNPPTARQQTQIDALLDVPVPIDGWDVFDTLFAWEQRPVGGDEAGVVPSCLGAAVRSFFAEGGRKCYVVRCGDPLPLRNDSHRDGRVRLLAWTVAGAPPDAARRVPVLPGLAKVGNPPSPADPASWHGAAHLFGLDDIALLSLPDLPDLFGVDPTPVPPLASPPRPPEQFSTCAPSAAAAEPAAAARPVISAPRLDLDGYRVWAGAVRHVLDMLRAPRGSAHRRDVQLIAAWPLPAHGNAAPAGAEAWPLALFQEPGFPAAGQTIDSAGWIGSALLQLAYPWIQTAGSAGLPEGIENPEGALAGAIARGALLNGAFRSIAGQAFATVTGTTPLLARGDILRGLADGRADWLGDRLCLIGPRSDGFVSLSDATMAVDRAWRAGGVSRLMGVILRAARWLGQDLIFEASDEALWARIRRSIEAFLTKLWSLGALDGASPAAAFEVRCDRTTMTQRDLDEGRVVVRIAVTAAQPVERITVTLALTEAGALAEAA